MYSLTANFNLLNEFNILRLICGLFLSLIHISEPTRPY